MDPTLHYKMKADEAYDGSGDGAADPIRMKNSDVQSETRAQKQQQNHRNGNRHLSMVIVNIETDAQTE